MDMNRLKSKDHFYFLKDFIFMYLKLVYFERETLALNILHNRQQFNKLLISHEYGYKAH